MLFLFGMKRSLSGTWCSLTAMMLPCGNDVCLTAHRTLRFMAAKPPLHTSQRLVLHIAAGDTSFIFCSWWINIKYIFIKRSPSGTWSSLRLWCRFANRVCLAAHGTLRFINPHSGFTSWRHRRRIIFAVRQILHFLICRQSFPTKLLRLIICNNAYCFVISIHTPKSAANF